MRSAYDVLVVDDDDDLREALVGALADEGFRVASARNGLEALGWLRSGRTAALILLDFAMPHMDGPAFCKARRADPALARVPVVVMSAGRNFAIPGDPEPVPTILKPLRLDDLVELVRSYAREPAPRDPPARGPG